MIKKLFFIIFGIFIGIEILHWIPSPTIKTNVEQYPKEQIAAINNAIYVVKGDRSSRETGFKLRNIDIKSKTNGGCYEYHSVFDKYDFLGFKAGYYIVDQFCEPGSSWSVQSETYMFPKI